MELNKEDLLFWNSKIYANVEMNQANIIGSIFFNGSEIFSSFFCRNSYIMGDFELNSCIFHKNVVFNHSQIGKNFEIVATKFKHVFCFP